MNRIHYVFNTDIMKLYKPSKDARNIMNKYVTLYFHEANPVPNNLTRTNTYV